MANVTRCNNCTETNLGDVDGAKNILNEYGQNTNDDIMMNIRFTVWAGNTVFKRNMAEDHDKKFYSYSLQVNIII